MTNEYNRSTVSLICCTDCHEFCHEVCRETEKRICISIARLQKISSIVVIEEYPRERCLWKEEISQPQYISGFLCERLNGVVKEAMDKDYAVQDVSISQHAMTVYTTNSTDGNEV